MSILSAALTAINPASLGIKVAIIAGSIILLFGGGYYMGCTQDQVHQAKAQSGAIAAGTRQVVADQAKAQTIVQKVYVQDQATVTKLLADKAALSQKVTLLQAKVDSYVPQIVDSAYVPLGAVRLLNNTSSSGSTGSQSSAPESTSGTADSDSQPSTLTWRQFVAAEISVRGQYTNAQNQCNALIQWDQDHIVNGN